MLNWNLNNINLKKNNYKDKLKNNEISNLTISYYLNLNQKELILKVILYDLKNFFLKILNIEKENNFSWKISLLKNVENIFQYNRNLLFINKIRNQVIDNYLKSKIYLKKNEIKKISKDYQNTKYYSELLKSASLKIKNKNKKVKDFIEFKRYKKTKNELIFLNKFFKSNNYLWNRKIIKELSNNLKLSYYSIYKWNWDKINKK